jgi:hypothetical protein
MDGLELTRRLRRPDMASRSMPVLILTARDALQDRVQGLDLGADDYMVKPFELPELLARLRACCAARRPPPRRCSLAAGAGHGRPPCLRPRGRVEHVIELGPREWTVLEYLLIHAPKPASKDKLLAGPDRLGQGNHAQCGGGMSRACAASWSRTAWRCAPSGALATGWNWRSRPEAEDTAHASALEACSCGHGGAALHSRCNL